MFGILDPDMRNRIHARSLTDEILSSLEIEGEKISYDSVYSSICKRLDIYLERKAKTDQYAEDVSTLVLDATGNLKYLSTARIKQWHSLLFSSMPGIKPTVIGDYRQGHVYIRKENGRESEIIYECLPAERIDAEMEKLIEFINGDNEKNPLVKSAVVSLYSSVRGWKWQDFQGNFRLFAVKRLQ